jgi:hypothetical protein
MEVIMKIKLFFIILIAILAVSCQNPVIPDDLPGSNPVDSPDPITPIDPPTGRDIQALLYDGETLRLWDGQELIDAYAGDIAFSSSRIISIGDVLQEFDSSANVINTRWLNITPDLVKTAEYTGNLGSVRATTFYEDDVYTVEIIEPSEAYSMGGLYKYYTRVYENGTETSPWYLNDWHAMKVVVPSSGEILILDDMGKYHNLTNDKIVFKAYDSGILIYNHDADNLTVSFSDSTGDYNETYTKNYFNSGRWQEANGVWYSSTGYSWSAATGLIENAGAMYLWNGPIYPTGYVKSSNGYALCMPAGVREENGEEVTYWLELSRGYVWRWIPSTNNLSQIDRAYFGDGSTSEITSRIKTIDPQLIDGRIWFHDDGSLMTFEIATGLVSVFSGDQELIAW